MREGDIEKILEDFNKSRDIYDKALWDGYGPHDPKWPEEKIKVWARQKCRQAGLDDPEGYRWRLRALLGSILE